MRAAFMLVIALGLGWAYLYPGSLALVTGRTDQVMSDGTDVTSVPYIWDRLRFEWDHHPARLLYGAVYSDVGDPEAGYAMWVSWAERLVGVPLTYVLPLAQISAAVAFAFMWLSGLAMYALGRAGRWPRWVAFALALSWAGSYYARARAQVHPAFVGAFHVPLIFLGLGVLSRDPRRRAVPLAALCFLGAATAPHYYVLTAAFLSPALLPFALRGGINKKNLLRAAGAALPAALFLAANFAFKVPAGARLAPGRAVPETGSVAGGGRHPFLEMFGARPIDYLGGNLALTRGADDPSPAKRRVNETIYADLRTNPWGGNPHERTNGVRWFVLVLAAVALVGTARCPRRPDAFKYLGVALFALALSLPPSYLFAGPAAWLYALVPQMRVPARAGLWVHFGLLMIVGEWASAFVGTKANGRRSAWVAVPLALAVLEDPPFYNQVRMAPVPAAFEALRRERRRCGTGLYFPFASNNVAQIPYYRFLASLRGSDCHDLNSLGDRANSAALTAWFPPAERYLSNLDRDELSVQRLVGLARCLDLDFVAFDPAVAGAFRGRVCRELGWVGAGQGLCLSPREGVALAKPVSACL